MKNLHQELTNFHIINFKKIEVRCQKTFQIILQFTCRILIYVDKSSETDIKRKKSAACKKLNEASKCKLRKKKKKRASNLASRLKDLFIVLLLLIAPWESLFCFSIPQADKISNLKTDPGSQWVFFFSLAFSLIPMVNFTPTRQMINEYNLHGLQKN